MTIQQYAHLHIVLASAISLIAGCGPVISSTQISHGTRETRLIIDMVDGPGGEMVEARVRIRRDHARVRLEAGERLFLNGDQFIRSTAMFSEALVVQVPRADSYSLEFVHDELVGRTVIGDLSEFDLKDVHVAHDGGEWHIRGDTTSTAPRGDTSQHVTFRQARGEAGEVEVSGMFATNEPFELRLSNARPRRGSVGEFGPGHALLTVSRVTEIPGLRMAGFSRVSATVRVEREQAVVLPSTIGADGNQANATARGVAPPTLREAAREAHKSCKVIYRFLSF